MVIRVQKAKAHWDYTPYLLASVEKDTISNGLRPFTVYLTLNKL